MHFRRATRRLALIAGTVTLLACDRAPSRAEALEALRATMPGIDTTVVFARVWQDGPPWFSCAEVIAKLRSPLDSAVVRDQVGNWKHLVVAGWLVLRDTASGPVSDPGWCTGKLADVGARLRDGWIPIAGDTLPTGTPRRGWRVPVGTRRLVVTAPPKATDRDAATVEYAATVAANPSGVAVGADRDTTYAVAELRKRDGRWTVAATRVAATVRR